jgi:hypothetical protein
MIRKIQLLFYELHRIFPRFKLWRICRALGIKPHKYQEDFALGCTDCLPEELAHQRQTGKTTAVMLRMLMVHPFTKYDALQIMQADADFNIRDRRRTWWYENDYKRMARKCYMANIPVVVSINLCDPPYGHRNR